MDGSVGLTVDMTAESGVGSVDGMGVFCNVQIDKPLAATTINYTKCTRANGVRSVRRNEGTTGLLPARQQHWDGRKLYVLVSVCHL